MLALAAAASLIAPVGGPVDATGSHLAYSRPEGSRHRLVIDGRDAPVAPLGRPFDVDLGTDARGRLVAVYTRSGRVHVLDVAAGRERGLRGVRGAAPSVSRGRVLYATRARRDGLRLTTLAGGRGRLVPLPRPTEPQRTVGETELAGGVLAYTAQEDDDEVGRTQLGFARLGGRPRILASAVLSVNQRTTFVNPAISSRWVTVGVEAVGEASTPSGALRVAPASRRRQRATVPDLETDPQAPGRSLLGFGLGGRAAYSSTCGDPIEDPDESPPDCRLAGFTPDWR